MRSVVQAYEEWWQLSPAHPKPLNRSIVTKCCTLICTAYLYRSIQLYHLVILMFYFSLWYAVYWNKCCCCSGQDRSMWRTLRPSAGQAQQWVSEWAALIGVCVQIWLCVSFSWQGCLCVFIWLIQTRLQTVRWIQCVSALIGECVQIWLCVSFSWQGCLCVFIWLIQTRKLVIFSPSVI